MFSSRERDFIPGRRRRISFLAKREKRRVQGLFIHEEGEREMEDKGQDFCARSLSSIKCRFVASRAHSWMCKRKEMCVSKMPAMLMRNMGAKGSVA